MTTQKIPEVLVDFPKDVHIKKYGLYRIDHICADMTQSLDDHLFDTENEAWEFIEEHQHLWNAKWGVVEIEIYFYPKQERDNK